MHWFHRLMLPIVKSHPEYLRVVREAHAYETDSEMARRKLNDLERAVKAGVAGMDAPERRRNGI